MLFVFIISVHLQNSFIVPNVHIHEIRIPHSSLSQTLAVIILLSISMNLTTLGTKYKWNYIELSFCDLFHLK